MVFLSNIMIMESQETHKRCCSVTDATHRRHHASAVNLIPQRQGIAGQLAMCINVNVCTFVLEAHASSLFPLNLKVLLSPLEGFSSSGVTKGHLSATVELHNTTKDDSRV